jgi:hypothetical protein
MIRFWFSIGNDGNGGGFGVGIFFLLEGGKKIGSRVDDL